MSERRLVCPPENASGIATAAELAEAVYVALREVAPSVAVVDVSLFDADFTGVDRATFDKARALAFDRFGVPYDWEPA